MKFTECYIENFGKLSQFKLEFTDGLNIILRENGFGKTTFAAFLQAMFYGLDSGRGKESDRKKYEPWQGGKFGGSINFSVNGKNYRMERFFGKKEKDDTFFLYNADTDLVSNDYTENIGCELFGIDKDSYGKSAYIPQGKVEAELSKAGDINAKLSDLLEADNDLASFDDAMESLKKLKNKYKRAGGLIGEKELVKSKLEAELEHAESLTETENEFKLKLRERKQNKNELDEKIEKLHLSSGKREKAEHYKTLKKAAEDSEKAISEYEKSVKKVPVEAEMKELSELTEEYKNAKFLSNAYALSEEDEVLINTAYRRMSYEEHEEISELIKKYTAEKAVVKAASLSESEERRLNELNAEFEGRNFDEALLDKTYYGALRANEALEKNSNGKKAVFPYVFSAILIITGILLTAFNLPMYGLLPLAAGIIYISTYILTYNGQKKKTKAEAEKILLEAKEFFASFGEDFSGSGEDAVRNIKSKLEERKSLETKKKNACDFEKNSSISDLKALLDAKTKEYLGKEFFTESCEIEFAEFFKASEKAKRAYEKQNKLNEETKKAESAFGRLKEKAGLYGDFAPEKAYEELNVLTVKLGEEKKNYENKLSSLKEFIAVNGVPEAAEEEFNMSELEALKAASGDMEEEIKSLEKRISDITEVTEKIPELTSELSEVTEEIELLKKKVSLIDKTEEALKTAKENLAAKYLGPLGEKFGKYKELLSAPESAKLDAELNVGVIEGGEKHSADFYSTGLRDAIAIAVRFALADALFEGEKPVVVLDDPFTNLDERRMESAKKMLETLSSEYQILYLTCHKSRG